MEFKDYYQILGVAPDVDTKALKAAYRKLARKYHPDVSDHADAEAKFKEASEAYEVLKDPEKRAEFDTLRQYGSHGSDFTPPPDWEPAGAHGGGYSSQSNEDFSDFFSNLFGGGFSEHNRGAEFNRGQGFQQRGRDVEIDLPLFLEETLTETSKPIAFRINGKDKKLQVKIPAGATEGERIRLKGQGEAGIGQAPAGDVYLRIKLVPHPLFDVEFQNLIITVPLAPWEAALGTKIEVPTLQGKIQLTVPANSQSGQRLRIRGRGLKTKQGQGDLYAVFNVVMPSTIPDSTKQYWEKLAAEINFDPRSEWSKS